MRHIPIAEFQDRASEIVAAAEAGEEIAITHNGREVVRLVAVEQEALLALREELRAKGVHATADELTEWKNDGRR